MAEKRLGIREARKLSEEVVVNGLLKDPGNGAVFRGEQNRRLTRDSCGDLWEWIVGPYEDRIRTLKGEIKALKAEIEELSVGQDDMVDEEEKIELWVQAKKWLDAGWKCQGMRNSAKALANIQDHVQQKLTWKEVGRLPQKAREGITGFYRSARYRFISWNAS